VVDVGNTRLIGWVLSAVALCVIVATTTMAYIETLYMKAHLKRAEKRIEKKLDELEKLKQELKEK
jgi:hypothetical protein